MSTIIIASNGLGTTSPDLVIGYETASVTLNIAHEPIGQPTDYTLYGEGLRAGTLRLLYPTEAAGNAARVLLGRKAWFNLESDDLAGINMRFVRAGAMTLRLDDVAAVSWLLDVGYQEIA